MPEANSKQWFDLAMRHQASGRLQEAQSLYRQVLSVEPNHLGALQGLAFIAYQDKRPAEAAELLGRAIKLIPADVNLLSNFGAVLAAAGELDRAIEAFQKALTLNPDSAQVHNNLGNALQAKGRSEEAVAAYRRALALRPDSAEAHNNFGTTLSALGRGDEAIDEYRRAVAIRPQFAQAWNNLATALREKGELDESISACERALALEPGFLPAHHNLGNTFRDAGRLDDAIACYRKASSAHNDPSAADDLLIATLLHANVDAAQVWDEHVRWNEIYAKPLAPSNPQYDNDRSPERRLRLGYVSPDFREHPVGRFILPLLENHEHGSFEIFCYSDAGRPDALTGRMQAKADHWRVTSNLSDEQLANLVRQDHIDILVDLTMHTKYNRMLMFARKPAPVQVTYLAYPGTTGLQTMDYRLTDPYLDPDDKGDIPNLLPIADCRLPNGKSAFHSEASVRLPRTFWCYPAPMHAPVVNALPALANGWITFGCLNLYSKVTPVMLSVWAQLLRQVPRSRLVLHSFRGAHREKARDILTAHRVDRERLEFVDRVPPHEYFFRYHHIDIALDTFPYPGGTTTCDALWMGVPVITLAGKTALSRGGLSILSNVGLGELVARTEEQYLQIARELSENLSRLTELRSTLREKMMRSPLMDAPLFARDVESAFRRMWRTWCSQPADAAALERLAREAYQRGETDRALDFLHQLIACQPAVGANYSNLAMVLAGLGRFGEATTALRQAVTIQPENAEAWNNLGNVLQEQGQFEDAAQAYRTALRHRPHFPTALGNLAGSLRDLGQLDEVIALYRSALAQSPHREIADNFLLTLHFHPDTTPQLLREEHARWNETYAKPLAPSLVLTDSSQPSSVGRRLRIGYVATEFHGGPTGRFLLPLLENHDRSAFEIFCYANLARGDATTERFRSVCDVWRQTNQLSDEQFAQLVREDRIDILIDCTNHQRGNRLLAFARKPAPIQVTYLPYCSTTGLDTIDYRITDPYLDPPDHDDRMYSERSVRLPDTYWCYVPVPDVPPVERLPALGNGFITFGCFNSYLKISNQVLSTWCRLLQRVGRSRIMITCRPGIHRQRAQDLFARDGIDLERLRFVDHRPAAEYFKQYHQIDIALDPFPYGGGTTTCDALWMGVPVVSVTGRIAVSRAGLSILSNVGLPELVGREMEEYLRIAQDLAANLPRLSELRATMRQRMRVSPLMDVRRFAADFETALRAMWSDQRQPR